MYKILVRGFVAFVGVVTLSMGFVRYKTINSSEQNWSSIAKEQVLGITDSIENMIFRVAIPAKFDDTVTFAAPISAPNLIETLQAGEGIAIASGTIPTISNTGILELVAGDGISVSGNKITSTITQGITTLVAGTNISIDGNKITNTYTAPTIDYTLSGWTTGTGVVYLSTLTDKVGIGTSSPTSALQVVGSSNLAGDVTLGTDENDDVTILGAISAGSSIIPANDLGADLGSTAKRFNNLWVANINSNSSQAFSGQTTFSYAPTDTTISQSSVLINPTTSIANGQLLGLSISGYQRALIDEDGDMILGYSDATSAPTTDYPLNIYGHSGTRVSYIDTSGNLALAAGSVIMPLSNSTTALNIANASGTAYVKFDTTNSRVGINKTPSNYALEVNGTITASYLALDNSHALIYGQICQYCSNTSRDIVINSHAGTTLIKSNAAVSNTPVFVVRGPASLTANLQEWQNSSATALSVINSSGNLGIGTTSPTSKLHVDGAVTGKALAIFNETGDQNILVASASGTIKFRVANNGSLYTSTDPYAIWTASNIYNNYIGIDLRGANKYKAIVFPATDANGFGTTIRGGNAYLTLEKLPGSNADGQLYVTSKLGVGSTAFGEALEVTGNIKTSSLTTGTVYSNSGVLTNTDPSDLNLKQNILDLPDSTLTKLLSLRPVSYEWKNTGNSALGFVAQDVESIFPELVGTNNDGTKGLYTTQFIPVLVKAIQELQQKITQLWSAMADKFVTKQICLEDLEGEICLNKSDLRRILETLPSPTPIPSPTPSPVPSPSPELVSQEVASQSSEAMTP